MTLFSTSFFAKYLRVVEDGPGRGICVILTHFLFILGYVCVPKGSVYKTQRFGNSIHTYKIKTGCILCTVKRNIHDPRDMEVCLWIICQHNEPAQSKKPYKLIKHLKNYSKHQYIQQYAMIQQTDSEYPDQTARMRRLILVFAVCVYPKDTYSPDAAWVYKIIFMQLQFA